MERVAIASGDRSCLSLQFGYGGAAYLSIADIECTVTGSTNPGFNINYPTAIINMTGIIIEIGGTNYPNTAMSISGGYVNIRGFHMEGYTTGIDINMGQGIVTIHHATAATVSCTNMVKREVTSVANSNVIGSAFGCTNTLNNGGATTSGAIIADTVF